jgi:hypothetical protein
MPFAHRLRQGMRAMLLALLVTASAAVAAADPKGFDAAVEQTSAHYQDAMRTIETRGREETAAAVHRLRQSFQETAERFAADRPPHLAGDADWPGEFMQIDVRLVGALLVIDMGSRDAARQALAPLAETLARLRSPAPAPR